MKFACSVNDRSVGIAVAIEIGPGKAAHARNSSEGMDREKCAVPVVSQNGRDAGAGPEHDIQIAIGFDIHGPRPGVGRVGDGLRKFGLSRHVAERTSDCPARNNRTPPAPASTRSVLKS